MFPSVTPNVDIEAKGSEGKLRMHTQTTHTKDRSTSLKRYMHKTF